MPGRDRVQSGVKLTYDDFLLFPDDGKRHELIDGEHYVTPSPNIRAPGISGRLHLSDCLLAEVHPVGRSSTRRLDVVFTNFDVVEPDLLYASHERARDIMTGQHVEGAPDLVIESRRRARASAMRPSSDGSTSDPV